MTRSKIIWNGVIIHSEVMKLYREWMRKKIMTDFKKLVLHNQSIMQTRKTKSNNWS